MTATGTIDAAKITRSGRSIVVGVLKDRLITNGYCFELHDPTKRLGGAVVKRLTSVLRLRRVALALWILIICLDPLMGQRATVSRDLTTEQQLRRKQRDECGQQLTEFRKQGKRTEALAVAEKKLEIERELLGSEHPDTLRTLVELAELHVEQEDFPSARKIGLEVLNIRTKLFGEEHWQVIDARVWLGYSGRLANMTHEQRMQLADSAQLVQKSAAFYRQEQFPMALESAQRALHLRAQVLAGPDVGSADIMDFLAWIHQGMSAFAQAEPLRRQSLEINRQILGEKHPAYAQSLNNFGVFCVIVGDYSRAELLHRHALAIRTSCFENDHLSTAESVSALADIYLIQREYAKAEPLLLQALKVRKRLLAPAEK